MGADTYMHITKGKTAQECFKRLREQAQWEHGHGGYSGTIAEKNSYVEFTRPKGMRRATVLKVINELAEINFDDYGLPQIEELELEYPALNISKMFQCHEDKWGPSLCIEVTKGEYLFSGWASS